MNQTDSPAVVRAYHERTKHRFERYAAGPQYLDWDDQPDPFRRFAGAPSTPLSFATAGDGAQPAALNAESLGVLFRHAFGLSAWKAFGADRWSLRCNPSSGNLHPTESYLICRGVPGLVDGVHHYAVHDHALELRGEFIGADTDAEVGALIGLTSIVWREAWKYGERAFRYVQLDVGHALGALRYAAALHGWGIEILSVADETIARLLGLDCEDDFVGADPEAPDLLVRVLSGDDAGVVLEPWLGAAQTARWYGTANALGGRPRPSWPILDDIAAATHGRFPATESATPTSASCDVTPTSLARHILERRSAQGFDPGVSLAATDFFAMLAALLPAHGRIPWDAWPLAPRLHPVLFVHNVDGLPRGLYCLPRSADAKARLQAAMRDAFAWTPPEAAPPDLPLFELLRADARKAARTLSCHQDIAATGAFSLAFIAEFDAALSAGGAAAYRHLYWEAGLLGQVLYLEAEARGVRGTGIGCFFDDGVHETLGLADHAFQSLYHFTVGTPVHDDRIQTLPPYAHLERTVLDELKARIATLWAERDALKRSLEHGDVAPRNGLAALARLDLELSDLDTRFKTLWDRESGPKPGRPER